MNSATIIELGREPCSTQNKGAAAQSDRAQPEYAELLCKTNYSFLTGASHPEELIERAVELNLHSLAITDWNGVYGLPKAFHKLRSLKEKDSGIPLKLICGAEIVLSDHAPVTVLAQTRAAYGLLCRLITQAHADKEKGHAAVSFEEFSEYLDQPASKQWWVLTPSIAARVSYDQTSRQTPYQTVQQHRECPEPYEPGHLTELSELNDRLQSQVLHQKLGSRWVIPVAQVFDAWDEERLRRARQAREIFQDTEEPPTFIATNHVHYHDPSRAELCDVLMANRYNEALAEMGFRVFSNSERYLKSHGQMNEIFKEWPELVRNTLKVAEACVFEMSELKYRYPSEWIPQGQTPAQYLRALVVQGADKRYAGKTPASVQKQIEHELELIERLGFADYFLTIWEIVEYAQSQEILCQGRGSAANSAVCFCLGITAIDPVRMNLLFERFISAERGEPPDIDVDFEHERREEVIQHIYNKYGRDRAAMVAAVVTYKSKSAIRDLARPLGVDLDVHPEKRLKQASARKWIVQGGESAQTLKADKAQGPPTLEELRVTRLEEKARELAEELKGFPRHLTIHSGGFTLSADPIIETVPVEPARMDDRTIIQWDKYDLDFLGLLKIDVLALGMLTAIRKCLEMVPGLKLHTIPPEDPATYSMIQKADTVGVFQIESRGQMNMLGRLQPKTFYDLVVEVAIVRPGPIVGRMVHPYLKRRKGVEPADYPHPKLKKILGKTLGVPLFQEQVMKMAIDLAGFSPGEADELRRAIGAWRSSGRIEAYGHRLKAGLKKSGLSEEFNDRIFDQLKGFAEYGFPESHAASFALLAYASSYLKCHYPARFTCALMNSQPLGFYSNHSLIEDLKRHGGKVLPVDPNLSQWNSCVDPETEVLRLGWRVIRGLSESKAEELIRSRDEEPYESLPDFIHRSGLRRDVLETIAMGDSFRCFGLHQRDALWQILAYQAYCLEQPTTGQMNLFSQTPAETDSHSFVPLSLMQEIQKDFTAFGLSLKGHPMKVLRTKLPRFSCLPIQRAREFKHDDWVAVAGLTTVRQRPATAHGTLFATLEDETGMMDLTFRPKIYEKFKELLYDHVFFMVRGKLQRDGYAVSLLVNRLQRLEGSQYF